MLPAQPECNATIGDHAEWLLGQGVSLSEVMLFAAALEEMRAVPFKVEAGCPDTERDVRSTTLPVLY